MKRHRKVKPIPNPAQLYILICSECEHRENDFELRIYQKASDQQFNDLVYRYEKGNPYD